MTRELAQLPKAHLHLHLEESVRQSTLDDFAAEAGVPTPRMSGFTSFIEFDHLAQASVQVMTRPEHLRRLVLEMAQDAAAQGCVWVEPALWPALHRDRFGPDDAVLEILVDAAAHATEQTGVGIGYLIAANRNLSVDEAVEQARLAARWAGRGVVAFGLHNDESRFPPEPFTPAFEVARAAGLLSTPHAGELDGPQSVRAAVEVLGADRVQHGIRAAEDPAVLELLIERDVCLDVCPTSNIVLKSVESFEAHPLATLMAAGVSCSLNADNPVMFDCDVLSEYQLARDVLGLEDDALAAVATASLRASGAPADLVAAATAQAEAWRTAAADQAPSPAAQTASGVG